jgi:hypothetical protein
MTSREPNDLMTALARARGRGWPMLLLPGESVLPMRHIGRRSWLRGYRVGRRIALTLNWLERA